MQALIIIAHGSRREESNHEVIQVVKQLQTRQKLSYDYYQACFLEIAKPCFSQAIDNLVKKGVNSFVVLPYFLSSGNHVVSDIPKLIRDTQQRIPGIEISLTQHIGGATMMLDLLESEAS